MRAVVDGSDVYYEVATKTDLNTEIYNDLFLATSVADYGIPTYYTSTIEDVSGNDDGVRIKKI